MSEGEEELPVERIMSEESKPTELEEALLEPDEASLPDKPPVPELEEDTAVPGEEEVPHEHFMSPEEAVNRDDVDHEEGE